MLRHDNHGARRLRRKKAIRLLSSDLQTSTADTNSGRGAVLLVANYPSDVGYAWWLMENFWAITARAMAVRGRSCFLAYPQINAIPSVIAEAPLTIEQCSLRPRSWRAVMAGLKFIRERSISSIYLTDWPFLSPVYLMWRLAGVRSIVLHDHTPGDRPALRGARAWVKRLLHGAGWFSCDAYVGVSDYIRQRFVDNGCIPAHKTLTVRNGIRAFDCDCDRAAVRRELGIDEEAFMVVLVSRATYYKGWDFAVRCLARLQAQRPDLNVQMVFCGDGPDLDAFKALASTNGVSARSHFLGRRSDVRSILCAADVALHPSRGEALSLATLEFMCASLPVIVPDRPSVSGVIAQEKTGVVYRAEDVDAAAAAIAALATNRAQKEALGRAARQAMIESYQLDWTNADFAARVVPRL